MTPERLRQLEELLHAALERDAHDREAFLNHACGGDKGLEQEVRELLASHQDAGSLLDRPAVDVVAGGFASDWDRPRLVRGASVGPYEINSQIGAGAMGEVYLATDTNLRRQVALKVLPASVAADPLRLVRFQREAELLATLNHPNIAAVYGLEKAGGIRALVMEFIDGPTLAERIDHGAIEVKEALAIARQIAEAVEAAHARGIVHRDLKPANVKVRSDGTVKVLDFGLAKALAPPSAQDLLHAPGPTHTMGSLTVAGTMMGTAPYMSPEQAAGTAVDRRSDIWAFGCVLYEMLCGTRAFPGDSIAGTLANVLAYQPDFTLLPPATPPRIVRLVRRCLEKDPRKRLHDMADARIEIDDAAADAPFTFAPATHSGGRTSRRWAAVGIVLALVAVAAIWRASSARSSDVAPVVRSVVATVPTADIQTGALRSPAISPDGTRIVFGAAGVLRLRTLDVLESQTLRGSEGGISPAFSRDGQSLAFFVPAESAIKRLSLRSGQVSLVTTTDGGEPRGLSWAPDDTIIFATTTSAGLWRVRATGGNPERLTTVVPGEALGHSSPFALPNGTGVLFEAFRGARSRVGVVSLAGRHEITYPIASGGTPRYAPTGQVMYVAEGTLWAIGFDAATLRVTDDARVSVVDGVQVDSSDGADFDVAANGALVYVPAIARTRELVWVSRDGQDMSLNLPPRDYDSVRVSPDGARIVAAIRDGARPTGIWVTEVDRPGWTRLPSSRQDNGDWFPKWTPDGRYLVFAGFGARVPSLFQTAVDGTGVVEPLLTIADNSFLDPRDWSPDGGSLLFTYGTPANPRIGVLSTADRSKPTWAPLNERGENALAGPISPDGHWIVTERMESGGSWNLYIERFPASGDRRRITAEAGGSNAVWSPDGRELFYRRASDEAMMAVSIQLNPLTIGVPRLLFERRDYSRVIDSRGWDVAPDGRFLMLKQTASDSADRPVILVQNWFKDLKHGAPTR